MAGADDLSSGDLRRVFPEGARQRSSYMHPSLADDLRYWLVEPDFAKTQRAPVELDQRQLALVTSRTQSGYRRIKGAAGSEVVGACVSRG